MLSTPHLLVGAALVKTIPNPLVSLPLAFLSHFVLDSIPHWDGSPRPPLPVKTMAAIFLEYMFGLSVVFILSSGELDQNTILLGAFFGTLPDFITGAYRYSRRYLPNLKILESAILRVPNEFHVKLQRNVSFKPGLVVHTIITLLAIFILL